MDPMDSKDVYSYMVPLQWIHPIGHVPSPNEYTWDTLDSHWSTLHSTDHSDWSILMEKQMEKKKEDEYPEVETSTRSLLMGLINQLRQGVELSKVIIPPDFLESRSLLERLSDLLFHADYALAAIEEKSPEERMLKILKWYLSAWYIRPRGVRKPYNPVLNETFMCSYDVGDGSKFSYFAEQVSHHPPISGFFGEHTSGVWAEGYYAPTTHFMGNSGCSSTEGFMKIHVEPTKETYICSWPDVYIRGLIFGTFFMELCGKTKLVCEESGIVCEIEFKPKPMWGGEANEIEVEVKSMNGKHLYSLFGKWDDVIYIKNRGKNKKKDDNEKRVFLEALKQKKLCKNIRDMKDQNEYESQTLWAPLTQAIKKQDLKAASDAKSKIEQTQRDRRKKMEENKEIPKPKWFVPGENKFWKFIGKEDDLYKSLFK
jgi:hypothetical protein